MTMSVVITLPASVTEGTLVPFIEQLGRGNGAPEVVLDFKHVKFMVPGALVALASRAAAWKADGAGVVLVNYESSDAFRYLQRMNLFRVCGYDLHEDFRRHDPRTRFVPVRSIARGAAVPETLATEVASVIVPEQADSWDPDESGPFDYVEYLISELASNILHHSRGTGFVSAQYYPQRGIVRVSLADCGIGIRDSFRNTPHWWEGMSDLEALQLALKPEVSSKSHLRTLWGESPNAGVGLSLLKELSAKTRGDFLVLSGESHYSLHRQGNLRYDFGFKGTLCAMTFHRDRVLNFPNLLYRAKLELGLIKPQRGDHAEMFE
jgi:anti-anti-sigma regulatory factor